jgi:hemerythrin
MALITWDDTFRTGNHLVDTQHQELFRMVNELHEAIVTGRGKDVLNPTLEKLVNYTVQHFGAEEALMRKVGYPAFQVHRSRHLHLAEKVKDLVGKYGRGELVVSITLSRFLADWLQHHILDNDLALIQYVQAQKPAPREAVVPR